MHTGIMSAFEACEKQILEAFKDVAYPMKHCISDSLEGEEPQLLQKQFERFGHWSELTFEELDQAPDGFGSSLSFFSDEALRHFMPGYMIAELRKLLDRQSMAFHMVSGFELDRSLERVNPRRYGARTWRDHTVYRFSTLDRAQKDVCCTFLRLLSEDEYFTLERDVVEHAIDNYWGPRD